ncbi:ATP-binding cassette domain-containing protein, partial [Sulfitobacter sp. 1A09134]
MSLLEIDKLNVTFEGDDGPVHAVNDLSLAINRGETLGIVGESGSGKSQTAFSIMGLL